MPFDWRILHEREAGRARLQAEADAAREASQTALDAIKVPPDLPFAIILIKSQAGPTQVTSHGTKYFTGAVDAVWHNDGGGSPNGNWRNAASGGGSACTEVWRAC